MAFVTGGSGFVGGMLIRALLARGSAVAALARSDTAAAAIQASAAAAVGAAVAASAAAASAAPTAPRITVVRGDLDSVDAMARGMTGCDVVFHAAAEVNDWGSIDTHIRVNRDGTRNVLAAARHAGVRRVVHISSEAVLADGYPLVNVDETRPRPAHEAAEGLYPLSKGMAEEEVEAAVRDHHQDAVIVRPRFVWGRGDTTLLPRFVEVVGTGEFRWPGGGHFLTSTCHVRCRGYEVRPRPHAFTLVRWRPAPCGSQIDNLIEGLLLAAAPRVGAGGAEPGDIYFVTDGAPVDFRAFVSAMLETQGVAPPTAEVPVWVMWPYATVSEWMSRTFGGGRPRLTRMAVALLCGEMTVVDAKARAKLGYRGLKTREAGLAELREDYERLGARPTSTSAGPSAARTGAAAAAGTSPGAAAGAASPAPASA